MAASPSANVDLGWLIPPERPVRDGQIRGRIVHLDADGMIVVPEHRLHNGWGCLVLATTSARPNARRVTIGPAKIAAARHSVAVDPVADPDTYAAVWEAVIWRQSRGGYLPMLARLLAGELRTPATIVVDLHGPAVVKLIEAVRLRQVGLRQLLGRLVGDGQLVQIEEGDCAGLGAYELTIPTHQTRSTSP